MLRFEPRISDVRLYQLSHHHCTCNYNFSYGALVRFNGHSKKTKEVMGPLLMVDFSVSLELISCDHPFVRHFSYADELGRLIFCLLALSINKLWFKHSPSCVAAP